MSNENNELDNQKMKYIRYNYNSFATKLYSSAVAIRKILEKAKPILIEIGKNVKEILKTNFWEPFSVIQLLGENQIVYWDYLTDDFKKKILNTKNIDNVIIEAHKNDNFKSINRVIIKIKKELKSHHKKLFSQSIKAYKENDYAISILGLFAICDALLSDISGNDTTSIYTRADAIIKKIKENIDVSNDEYAIVILILTFNATMETLSTNKFPFDNKEPKLLNRHWIMHGRSKRKITQLDCIKVINFIYAIILIDNLSKKKNEENE